MTIERDFETVRASIGGVSAEQQGQALAALSRIEAEVERLQAENEGLRGNLKGNPVLSTFDGIANLQAEVERLRTGRGIYKTLYKKEVEENERLRAESQKNVELHALMEAEVERLRAERDTFRNLLQDLERDSNSEVERLRDVVIALDAYLDAPSELKMGVLIHTRQALEEGK
jgi:chromosome segregation ATPase